jgi:mono/diheme cytochrome c family protein
MHARIVAMVTDRAPVVRRQLAASLGELPGVERDAALMKVLAASGDDPVVADLVATGVAGRELAFLESVLASPSIGAERYAPVVRSLSAAVMASRDAPSIERMLALLQPKRPRWQQLALLGARGEPAPTESTPEGGPVAGPRGRRRGVTALALGRVPAGLVALMSSRDTVLRAQAARLVDALAWPGKAGAAPRARPLTAEEQARYTAGQQQYAGSCAGCHQARGTGLPGVAKPLVGSPWVLGAPVRLIRIVLHGKEGEMLMPPVGGSLTDDQLANVLTYVRRSWGNAAAPITPTDVREVRGATMGRNRPWTEAELEGIRR